MKISNDTLVKEFALTGECVVDIDKVVEKWKRGTGWLISKYGDEYTLMHQNKKATNFTKTDFKVRISHQQASEIISKMSLIEVKDSFFKRASIWRALK